MKSFELSMAPRMPWKPVLKVRFENDFHLWDASQEMYLSTLVKTIEGNIEDLLFHPGDLKEALPPLLCHDALEDWDNRRPRSVYIKAWTKAEHALHVKEVWVRIYAFKGNKKNTTLQVDKLDGEVVVKELYEEEYK